MYTVPKSIYISFTFIVACAVTTLVFALGLTSVARASPVLYDPPAEGVSSLSSNLQYPASLPLLSGEGREFIPASTGYFPISLGANPLPFVAQIPGAEGICDRTEQVRDAILARLPEGLSCSDVTPEHLSSIDGQLRLIGQGIDSLDEGDFSGLTSLQILLLGNNQLTSLPPTVFSDLESLEDLRLIANDLETLHSDVFSGLTSLQILLLGNNQLTSLPSDVFSDLEALYDLRLAGNRLEALPPGLFSGLNALSNPPSDEDSRLDLSSNLLTSLPPGVISAELEAGLDILNLADNPWASPLDVSDVRVSEDVGTASITVELLTELGYDLTLSVSTSDAGTTATSDLDYVALSGSAVTIGAADPAGTVYTVDVELTPDNEIESDENFEVHFDNVPLYYDGSVLVRSLRSEVTIENDDYSEVLVSFDSNAYELLEGDTATLAVTLDRAPGRLLSIPLLSQGFGVSVVSDIPETLEFASGQTLSTFTLRGLEDVGTRDDNLTLEFGPLPVNVSVGAFTRAEVSIVDNDPILDVCDRTPEVQAAIITAVDSLSGVTVTDCDEVTESHVRGIGELRLMRTDVTGLQVEDFSGLSGLSLLSLGMNNNLTSLPSGLFTDLESLYNLALTNNGLTSLPPDLFSGLNSLEFFTLHNEHMTSLPPGLFSGLNSLREIEMSSNNLLTSLPPGLFSGLDTLRTLRLNGNALSSLRPGVISAELEDQLGVLNLSNNPWTSPLAVSDMRVFEDAGTVSIAVDLLEDLGYDLMLPVSTSDITATSGLDYIALSVGVVTIGAADLAGTVYTAGVQLIDDDEVESDESFEVRFDNVPVYYDGSVLVRSLRSEVTIANDEYNEASVSFGSDSYVVSEGATVEVEVFLDSAPGSQLEISVIGSGSGLSLPAIATFGPSSRMATFTLMALEDLDDNDESVTLMFDSLPSGISLGTQRPTAVVSILDDDDPIVSVSFDADSYSLSEGSSVVVTVRLNVDPERRLDLGIETDDASGSLLSFSPSSVVTFVSGELVRTFTVTALHDNDFTNDEVELSFSAPLPDRVTLGTPSSSRVVISDDELEPVEISFDSSMYEFTEGNTTVLTVNVNRASVEELFVPLSLSGDSFALHGVPSGVTIDSGSLSSSFEVSVPGNDVPFDARLVSFGFDLSTLSGVATTGDIGTAELRVLDDDVVDCTGSVALRNLNTGAPSRELLSDCSVLLSVKDILRGDGAPDLNWSLDIPIINWHGVAIRGSTTPADRVDVLDLHGGRSSDRNNIGGLLNGVLPWQLYLMQGLTKNSFNRGLRLPDHNLQGYYPVDYERFGEGEPHFAFNFGVIDIAGNLILGCIPPYPTGTSHSQGFLSPFGNVSRPGEGLNLADVFTQGPDGTDMSGNICERGFTVSDTSLELPEGGTAEYTFVLDSPPGEVPPQPNPNVRPPVIFTPEDEEVEITVSSDNPDVLLSVPGQPITDLDPMEVTLIFRRYEGSWHTPQPVQVHGLEDDDDFLDEVVTLSHTVFTSDVKYESLTPSDVTVSLRDNDLKPVDVSFDMSGYSLLESGDVEVILTLDSIPLREVVVPLTYIDTGAVDVSGPDSVTFGENSTTAVITISGVEEVRNDDGDTVELRLGTPLPEEVFVGSLSSTVLSIIDDDGPEVQISFSSASYEVLEGGDVTTDITVVLSGNPERLVEVPVLLSGSVELLLGDIPDVVRFESGTVLTVSYSLSGSSDPDFADDTVLFSFDTAALPGGVTVGDVGVSELTILDDDVQISFDSATYIVSEGDETTVAVRLSRPTRRNFSVELEVSGDSSSLSDPGSLISPLIFSVGDSVKDLPLMALEDSDFSNENIFLEFGDLPGFVSLGVVTSAVLSINDNDVELLSIEVSLSTDQAGVIFRDSDLVDIRETIGTALFDVTFMLLPRGALASSDIPIEITVAAFTSDSPDPSLASEAIDFEGFVLRDVIEAGLGEKVFRVEIPIISDRVVEFDERFSLLAGVTESPASVSSADIQAELRIIDTPLDGIVLTLSPSVVYEGDTSVDGSTLAVRAVLEPLGSSLERELEASLSITGGSAVSESDFVIVDFPIDGELPITNDEDGEGTSFGFHVLSEGEFEEDETVVFSASTFTADGTLSASTILTIKDQPFALVDNRGPTRSLPEHELEGGEILVDLAGAEFVSDILPSHFSLVSDLSGISVSSVSRLTPSRVIMVLSYNGESLQGVDSEFRVTVLRDGHLANQDIVSLTAISVEASVLVEVSFGSASYEVNEDGETAVDVSVFLNEDPGRDLSITILGSGVGASDVSGLPATVEFSSGVTEATFSLSAIDDLIDDDGETLLLEFDVLPLGVSAGDISIAEVSILDNDDPLVQVSFGASSYEVAEGGRVEVEVVLDAVPERPVTLDILSSGSGLNDVSGVASSVTFGVSDLTQRFIVSALDDDEDDDLERVELSFAPVSSLPSGVEYGSIPSSVILILDDDEPPAEIRPVTVSFVQSEYLVGEGRTLAVSVVLNEDPGRSLSITILGSGVGASDVSGLPATVEFSPDATDAFFVLSVIEDLVDDDDETLLLEFDGLPPGVSAGDISSVEVSILDNDDPEVLVSFGAASYEIDEGGTVTVEVVLDAVPERTLALEVRGSGSGLSDVQGLPFVVTFGRSSTVETFILESPDDTEDDDDESVTLSFGSLPSGVFAGTPSSAEVFILDDDVDVFVSFGSDAYELLEGGAVAVTVTLDRAFGLELSIPLLSQGSGVSVVSGVPETLEFASDETMLTFTVIGLESAEIADQSFTLEFGQLPVGVSVGELPRAVVSIMDADSVCNRTLEVQNAILDTTGKRNCDEVNAEDLRLITFEFTIENTEVSAFQVGDFSGMPLLRALTISDNTNLTSALAFPSGLFSDLEGLRRFDLGGNALTTLPPDIFSDLETLEVIFLGGNTFLTDNALTTLPPGVFSGLEALESLDLRNNKLSSLPPGLISPELETRLGSRLLLANNPWDFALSSPDVSVTEEAGAVTLMVSLTHSLDYDLVLNVSSSVDTADGSDYTLSSTDLMIPAGALSGAISVSITDDLDYEAAESFEVLFSDGPQVARSASSLESTSSTSEVTILESDGSAVTVSFDQSEYVVAEGDSEALSLVLDTPPGRTLAIGISSSPEGSTTPADYDIPATVTFGPADTVALIRFEAVDDAVDDDDEVVVLGLDLTGLSGVSEGRTTSVRVAIEDDDDPLVPVSVSFGASEYSVDEGDSVDVRVFLDADPVRRLSINILGSGVGALAVSGLPATVEFSSGVTEASFSLFAIDDLVDDDGKTFVLEFGELPPDVFAGDPSSAEVFILDNDEPLEPVLVSFGSDVYELLEGGTVAVTVTLDRAFGRELSIPLLSQGSGVSVVTGVPETLEFASDETMLTFMLRGLADANIVDESLTLEFGLLPVGVSVGAFTRAVVSITDDSILGVCLRASEVRDAIVTAAGNTDCAEITDDQLSNIEILQLEGRNIGELQVGDFSGLTSLMILSISGASLIEPLPSDLFSGLGSLTDLNLSSNDLTTLPSGLFSGLGSLTDLNLGSNDLTTLPSGLFSGLGSLTDLDLSDNALAPTDSPSGLPSGSGANLVEPLPEDLFSDLESLTDLDLSSNALTTLPPDAFSGLALLESLDLSSNALTTLPEGVFSDLESLESLDLSSNVLSSLPPDVFSGLGSLTELDLSSNELSSLPPGLISAELEVRLGSGLNLADNPWDFALSSPDVSVAEEAGSVTVMVSLTHSLDYDLVLSVSTIEGTADGSDYTLSSTDLTIATGALSGLISVSITDDLDYEAAESFEVSFSDGPQVLSGDSLESTSSTSEVTILESDIPAVTVSFDQSEYVVAEGASEALSLVLDTPPARTLVIGILASPEGSTTSSDYDIPATVTFGPTETVGTIIFEALDDVDNDDEVVVLGLDLTGLSNVSEGTNVPARVTIEDDDDPLVPVSVSFGRPGYDVEVGDSVTVTVSLNVDPLRTVTIAVSVDNTNVSLSSDELEFISGGVRTQSVTVTASSTGTATLSFTDLPPGVTVGTPSTTVINITAAPEPEPEPVEVSVSFGEASYEVNEGMAVDVEVFLDADPLRNLSINILGSGVGTSAVSGLPATVEFSPGVTEASFSLFAIDDLVDDDGETLLLEFDELPSGVFAGDPSSAEVSIIDDDPVLDICSRTPEVQAAIITAANSLTGVTVTGCEEITQAHLEAITMLRIQNTGVTELQFGDFSGLTSLRILNISDNQNLETLSSRLFSHLESLEFLHLDGNRSPDGSRGLESLPPDLFFDLSNLRLLNLNGNTLAELPQRLFVDLEVLEHLLLSDNVLESLPPDLFSGLDVLVSLNLGNNRLNSLHPDLISSELETGLGSGLILTGNPWVSSPLAVSDEVDQVRVFENVETASITVELLTDLDYDLTLSVSTVDVTAESELDYVALSNVLLTIGSEDAITGAIVGTVDVGILRDSLLEDDETFELVFTGVPVIYDGSDLVREFRPTVTISEPVFVSFGSDSYAVNEGGTVPVEVVLDAVAERTLEIEVRGSGNGLSDVPGLPFVVTFGPSSIVETFILESPDDTDDDDGESVTLSFGSLPSGVFVTTPSSAEVSISDDDPVPSVSFGQSAYELLEGDTVTVAVTLDRASNRPLSIPLLSQGSGVSVVSGVPETLEFAPDQTESFFTLEGLEDIDIISESLTLELGPLPVGVSAGEFTSAEVSIVDNDLIFNVCDRTPEVQAAIITAANSLPGVTVANCEEVTRAHLEAITVLGVARRDVTELRFGDFSGLISLGTLEISNNPNLMTLPSGLFVDLGMLENLFLNENALTSLPSDLFSGLGNLRRLGLVGNSGLTTLPSDLFSGLSSLENLELNNSGLTSLPPDLFSGLDSLAGLELNNNALTSLPPDLFSGLDSLAGLELNNNALTSLPPDLFSGLDSLAGLELNNNALTSLPPDLFSGLDSLASLVLNNNALTSLPPGLISAELETRLSNLRLNNNPWASPLAVSGVRVFEDIGIASINVNLLEDLDYDLSLSGSTFDVSATSGLDYVGISEALLTLGSEDAVTGAIVGTVDVSILSDSVLEEDETFELVFTNVPLIYDESTDALVREFRSTVTILEPVLVSFGSDSYTVDEGGRVAVEVVLDAVPEGTLTIEVTGSGSGLSDVIGLPFVVMFGPSSTVHTFNLESPDDNDDDDDESVTLSFGSLSSGVDVGTPSSSEVSILDDDPPVSSVSFGAGTYELFEGGTVAVTVTLDRASNRPLSIPLLSQGSGVSVVTGVPETLEFAPDETMFTFMLRGLADANIVDESLTLEFGLLPIDVSVGEFERAVVSITDSETIIGVCDRTPEVRDAIVTATGTSCNEVTLAQLGSITMLRIQGTGVTELQFGDFSGLTSLRILNISDNQNLETLSSRLFSHLESLEFLHLDGNRSPDGSRGLESLPPDLFYGLDKLRLLNLNGNTLAELSQRLFVDLEVLEHLLLSDNVLESLPPDLFSGLDVLVSLNLGNNRLNSLHPDLISAELETGLGSGLILTGNPWVSSPLAVSDEVDQVRVFENVETASITVELLTDLDYDLTLSVSTVDVTAESELDYVALSNVLLTIGSEDAITGAIVGTVDVGILRDSLLEDDETFELVFTGVPVIYDGSDLVREFRPTVTISEPVFVSFGSDSYAVDEGGTVPVEVVLDAVAERTLEIEIRGSGNGLSDVPGLPFVVTFGPSSTVETFILESPDDTDDDDNESVTLLFGSLPSGVLTGTPSSAEVSISDDDPVPSVSFGQSAYELLEGDTVPVTVTLDRASNRLLSIPILGQGSGVSVVSGIPETLEFAPDQTISTFMLSGLDDLDANDESLALEFGPLPAYVSAGVLTRAEVSIMDDDLVVSVCDRTPEVQAAIIAAVNSLPTITVTSCDQITLDHLSQISLLKIDGTDVTELQVGDFSQLTSLRTLNIVDNNNLTSALPSGLFSGLDVLANLNLSGNNQESLSSGLFSGLDELAGLKLNDNDLVSLPSGLFSGLDNLETLELTGNDLVSLPSGLFSGLDNLETLELSSNDLVSLPSGLFSGLNALTELILENNDLMSLPPDLIPAALETRLGSDLNLMDNPWASPLAISDERVSEAAGVVSITVNLLENLGYDLALSISTSDVSATSGSDYVALSNALLTIGSDASMGTVDVSILPDSLPEGDETFELVFTNVPLIYDESTRELVREVRSTVTISGSDTVFVSFGSDSYTVEEGGTIDVPVSLSADPLRTVKITVSVDNTNVSLSSTELEFISGSGRTMALRVSGAVVGTSTLSFIDLPSGVTAGIHSTTVIDIAANERPVADAGPDQTVAEGVLVTLDGSGSTDPEGTDLSYSWVQTSGETVTLSGSTVAQPTFTSPVGLSRDVELLFT